MITILKIQEGCY